MRSRSIVTWALVVFGLVLVAYFMSFNMAPTANADTETKATSSQAAVETYAVFGGGCFWCVEKDFEEVEGVMAAISGYSGGKEDTASYKKVASGNTDHVEVVKVIYDPQTVDYATLLEYFWRQINPTDNGGQFVDRGAQYRPVIFYVNEKQRQIAQASLDALAQTNRYDAPMAVEIAPYTGFYQAELYHQDYYKKSPFRYKTYRYGSGRDQYLKKTWGDAIDNIEVPASVQAVAAKFEGKAQSQEQAEADTVSGSKSNKGFSMPYSKPDKAELKEMLTPMQYKVTQEDGTEPPFKNEYHDEKREGVYVDIVSGEPLFSSKHKYDSGTGWPSFSQPLVEENIVTKKDYKLILPRTEVRSKHADSHLGHVFNDGPEPTGLRYCMNSAAMRFIPKENLEQEGYGEFLAHFESE